MTTPSAPSPPREVAPREISRREQSFPLIAIVQLVTYCVALVTCIDFKKLGQEIDTIPMGSPEWAIGLPIAMAVVGFALGAGIGLGQIHKWRGFFLCGTVGAMVSVLVLSTFAAPAGPLQACFACLLPLVSTLVLRFRTS